MEEIYQKLLICVQFGLQASQRLRDTKQTKQLTCNLDCKI